MTRRIRHAGRRGPLKFGRRAVVLLVTLLLFVAVGVSSAVAFTDARVLPVAPPTGPTPDEWRPPDYAQDDQVLVDALRAAYRDDYQAILSGGVMVKPAADSDPPGGDTPLITGLLNDGRAVPDLPTAGFFRNGRLVKSMPAIGELEWLVQNESVAAVESEAATDEAALDPTFAGDDPGTYWHGIPEPDDALYVGYVEVESAGSTGLKCAMNIADRHTLRDYYLIAMYNPANSNDALAFELAEYTQGSFKPFLHIKYSGGDEFTKWYTSKSVSIGWHSVRIERSQSTGRWSLYLDGSLLEGNLYWPTSPYHYYPLTQVEAFYETQYESVHDPANHPNEIYLRLNNYSTWSKWTNASWGTYEDDGHYAQNAYYGSSIPDKYSYIQFLASPDFHDWMLRD